MPERIIVNYGVYQLSEAERSAFRLNVYTQVEKRPANVYDNFKYQKPQSFYGYAQFMIGEWVYRTVQLEYENQLIYQFNNWQGQQAILLYCATQQTRDNIIALSTCIPACALAPGEQTLVGVWRVPVERIVFKLHAESTLLVNTDVLLFANPCQALITYADVGYTPPPLSQTDVPPNPLDDPYDIPDAPYAEPDDGGETYNPQRPEEPIGGEDRPYQVTTNARYISNLETGATAEFPQTYTVQGPVFDGGKKSRVSESGGSTTVEIWIEIRYGNNEIAESSKQTTVGTLTESQVSELIGGYVILEVSVIPL